MISFYILIFSFVFSLAIGWTPGVEYKYKYNGKAVSGVKNSEVQNRDPVLEIGCSLVVQVTQEDKMLIKLEDLRYHLGTEMKSHGHEIPDLEFLSAPFSISHKNGRITGVMVDANEPPWVIHYKKSVVSLLNIIDGKHNVSNSSSEFQNGKPLILSAYEELITGTCKANITIKRLDVKNHEIPEVFNLTSLDGICRGTPVYEIVKTKDFNDCQNDYLRHSVDSYTHTLDISGLEWGDIFRHSSFTTYLACGDLNQLTLVHAKTFTELLVQPFATNTDELSNTVVITLILEKEKLIDSQILMFSSSEDHESLSYVADDHRWNENRRLKETYLQNPVQISTLHRKILNTLRLIEHDLKERLDGEPDHLERLATIVQFLPLFPLQSLNKLWLDVKNHSNVIQSLFVDCAVLSGTNTTVMLIKQLIESKQITGHSADSVLSSLAHYINSPDRELIFELMNLLKSEPVRSTKLTRQTVMMTIANVLHRLIGSRSLSNRSRSDLLVDDIVNEFLMIISKELEIEQDVSDRIILLSILGSVGVEEVLPVLLPIINGSIGKTDDTAERLRAILSLHRVVHIVPEKIHPVLATLANNVSLRPELRMAALGILLLSNPDLSVWKHFAIMTWFEPSRQVESFIFQLMHSLSQASDSHQPKEMVKKARIALSAVKPSEPSSSKFSFSLVGTSSSHLDKRITLMIQSILLRNPSQSVPVYFGNRFSYRFGALDADLLSLDWYNFNMADLWQTLAKKFYKRIPTKYDAMWSDKKPTEQNRIFHEIWDELNMSTKQTDKRAGLLHVNLAGSIEHFFHLAKLDEMIPKYMVDLLKYHYRPYRIALNKYRLLANYEVRIINELGLPVRYSFKVPLLASMQGTVKADTNSIYKSDLNSQLNVKFRAELRVDIPSSGDSIASGVEIQIGVALPKQLSFKYSKGELALNWTLGNKVIDFFRHQIKPYAITRRLKELSDRASAPHFTSDTETYRNCYLGDLMGINFCFIEQSRKNNTSKWRDSSSMLNVRKIVNLIFPLNSGIHHRKLLIRYDPSGTRARSVSTNLLYRSMERLEKNTLMYESGSNQSKILSDAEVIAYSRQVPSEFVSLIDRLFKKMDGGEARLMKASLTAEQINGTLVGFRSVLGTATNSGSNNDVVDWYTEFSTIFPNVSKQVDSAFCYSSHRNWNNPPTHGFSQDVLSLNQVDNIGYGASCENKAKVIAKVYRDEEAALAAIGSPAGQQCLLDMESGFRYGSPACSNARILDHTYNRFELFTQLTNFSSSWLQSVLKAEWQRLESILEPRIVRKIPQQDQSSGINSGLIFKYNPISEKGDVTFVNPRATVMAENIGLDDMKTYLPFVSLIPPLTASSSLTNIGELVKSTMVGNSKCYVGTDAVFTFDGLKYNYTLGDCHHVLLTDCERKSELVVSAKSGKNGQKIVTIMYEKDVLVLDPDGFATVNGVKTELNSLENGNCIHICSTGAKFVKATLRTITNGILLDIKSMLFKIKVQRSHVEISAPPLLRSRLCGLCGNYNQETDEEFQSPDANSLPSGKLMASHFKLNSSCVRDRSGHSNSR